MKELIMRCALQNAVKYDGKATVNSVLGLVFSLDNKLDKKKVIQEVSKIVPQVNKLKLDEQIKKLGKLGAIKKKRRVVKSPSLDKVRGKIVMRFAPNPNGAMTFGHSRVALWNWFFVNKYKGKYVLRYDDTDPRIKVPLKDAYKWFKEDLKWLGVTPKVVETQSKRLKTYYKYAEELIKKGGAYVDTTPAEKMREMLKNKIMSDERGDPPSVVMEKWKKMFTSYKDGQAVLRVKTDMMHPNPAIRDWAAFRIIRKHKHPLSKERVWPLLNFSSAIDDHLLGVTHILRGSDLEVSDARQKYVYDYFGWKYPITKYNGKFLVSGIKSTSEANELIKEKKLSGWDDPRLGTLKSLRKRGFQSEAIIKFIKDQGIGKNDLNVNISALESYNRDVIDKKANRYFFVEKPRKIKVDFKGKDVSIPLHPDFPRRGSRKFKVKDSFYVRDYLERGNVYRFMYLFNYKNEKVISEKYDADLNSKAVHWLPVSKDLVDVMVVMGDNSVKRGLGEAGLKKLKVNDMIQFERFGFCRLDKKDGNKLRFYFTHK